MRYIGIVLLLNAAFMLLSLIISVINHDAGVQPLLYGLLVTMIWGFFPLIFVPKTDSLNNKEGFVVVVFSWCLSCVFGMLPYVFWGGEFTLTKAFFESVSGYTTAGGSVLANVEALPKGLLFWRSSTHWIGGLGIVVFMLLVLPSLGKAQMLLSKIEISSLAHENFKFRSSRMLQIILSIYIGLTACCTILFMCFGMDPFDAVNHAFSTISTGGFSTKNTSIAHFNSLPIELVTIFFMFIAGIHFGVLYSTLTFKKFNLFRSPVVHWYFVSTLLCGLIIAVDIHGTHFSTWGQSFRHAMFQAVSIVSTTGFATTNTAVWPPLSIIVLMYLTIQCACSGSTAGGIKSDRMIIFFKRLQCQLRKLQHPQAQLPIKLGNKTLDEDIVNAAILFIALYLFVLLISTVLLTALGIDLMTAFSSSAAALGDVGPGFGLVGSTSNYSCLPNTALLILCADMLLGRLEILGLLLLITLRKWK